MGVELLSEKNALTLIRKCNDAEKKVLEKKSGNLFATDVSEMLRCCVHLNTVLALPSLFAPYGGPRMRSLNTNGSRDWQTCCVSRFFGDNDAGMSSDMEPD